MDYVCGRTQETGAQKTYYNQCNLDRKACERNQTIENMHLSEIVSSFLKLINNSGKSLSKSSAKFSDIFSG